MDHLPPELIYHILSFIDKIDMIRFVITNRTYYEYFPKIYPIVGHDYAKIDQRLIRLKNIYCALSHAVKSNRSIVLPNLLDDNPTIHNLPIVNIQQLCNNMKIKLKLHFCDTYHSTFIAYSDECALFALKMYPYSSNNASIFSPYNSDVHDYNNPPNSEIKISYILSTLVTTRKTPHIALPITCFVTGIYHFIKYMPEINGSRKCERCDNLVEKYHEGNIKSLTTIFIYEFYQTLSNYIRPKKDDLLFWRVILFQIFYTLDRIQDIYPSFRHNELKYSSIVIGKTKTTDVGHYSYQIGKKKFIIPNIGYTAMISDFDLSSINSQVDNNQIYPFMDTEFTDVNYQTIKEKNNKYYDVYYFCGMLLSRRQASLPNDILIFLRHVISPYNYYSNAVSNRGRLRENNEYMTPYNILTNFELFTDFMQ